MKISAEARNEIRKAITNHPRWDDYRRANSLSLATMTRDDYLRTAEALNIDVAAIAGHAVNGAAIMPATPSHPVIARAQPAQTQDTAPMASVAAVARAQSDFANAPAPVTPAAVARAQADFADVESKPDTSVIPDLPVPLADATVAKIDSILALAVDPDISFSTLYSVARNAIATAHALRNELENAQVDPRAAKLSALTKPSLDFVPPSWSRDFADYVDIGASVAVVGPAGNGKTTGARKLLERAGFTVYEFDCTDATLPQDLIGRTSLRQENGATVTEWTAGPIAKAFADPKGAVLLNEYDALDPRTGMALQSAFEAAETRRVTAPDTGEQIHSTGPCPIILTLNTIGHGATVEYQGRNALDGANRDRLEIIVTGYENEKEIVIAHGHDASVAERLANWAKDTRVKLGTMNSREILSNRRILTAASLMERCGYSLADAVQKSFFCRMAPNELKRFPGMA